MPHMLGEKEARGRGGEERGLHRDCAAAASDDAHVITEAFVSSSPGLPLPFSHPAEKRGVHASVVPAGAS